MKKSTFFLSMKLIVYLLLIGFLYSSNMPVISARASEVEKTGLDHPAASLEICSPVAAPTVKVEEIVSGLKNPVEVKHAGDGSDRLFIVEQEGRILIWNGSNLLSTPFLELPAGDVSCCGERGLLSVAFHPDYASNGFFYIYYTHQVAGNPPESRIVKYSVSADPDLADISSGEILLQFPQPYYNHNGGQLHFGPDGYLYISFGDGGSAGDPDDLAQNLSNYFGTILRIDVDGGTPYAIPIDNPYLEDPDDPDTLGEIWLYGFRNPWRYSFDRLTGDLFIGDVGQEVYEEVDYFAAGSPGGENYGWRCYEGFSPYNTAGCGPAQDYVDPILVYPHDTPPCSAVTGGYVYRGNSVKSMIGQYVYGDYCSGKIWVAEDTGGGNWVSQLILDTDYVITSFGEDEAGELYMVHYDATNGKLLKLVEQNSDHAGFYEPVTGIWRFRRGNSWTDPVKYLTWGPSEGDWTPLTGDWDNDSVDEAGFYDSATQIWRMRSENSTDGSVSYLVWGPADQVWLPLVGDWDNDGIDEAGFYDPDTGIWRLRSDNTYTAVVSYLAWGISGSGWLPVVGDWDGDGWDEAGFYDPATNIWRLKSDNTWDAPVTYLVWGISGSSWIPLSGDWDGDGIDEVGFFDPDTQIWRLKEENTWSANVIYLLWGPEEGGWTQVTGDW